MAGKLALRRNRPLLKLLTAALLLGLVVLFRYLKPFVFGSTRILWTFSGAPETNGNAARVTSKMANTADFTTEWLNRYYQNLMHEVLFYHSIFLIRVPILSSTLKNQGSTNSFGKSHIFSTSLPQDRNACLATIMPFSGENKVI